MKRGDLVRAKVKIEDYVYKDLYNKNYYPHERQKIIIPKGSIGVVTSKGKYASKVNFSNHRMKKSWNDMSKQDLDIWNAQNELTTIKVNNDYLEPLYYIN